MILKCFSNFALLELEPTIFLEVADIPQVASKWQSYIRKVSNEPESEKECQLLAALEEWEYAVYQSNSCYLGTIVSNMTALQITTDANQAVKVRAFMKELSFAKDAVIMRGEIWSFKQDPFIYKIQSFSPAPTWQPCSYICFFDTQCEIFWIRGQSCYFGNFQTNGTLDDGFTSSTHTRLIKGKYSTVPNKRAHRYEF